MLCPSCNGTKRSYAFIEYADKKGNQGWIECHTCKGTGEVDDDYSRRIEQGRRLRHKRVKGGAYLTQKEMALKAGVDVVSLSKMEHGEQPIPESVWQAYGLEVAE